MRYSGNAKVQCKTKQHLISLKKSQSSLIVFSCTRRIFLSLTFDVINVNGLLLRGETSSIWCMLVVFHLEGWLMANKVMDDIGP